MANRAYRLAALGRLAADTRDSMGDTLGSFSGMSLEGGSWRVTGDGCAGVFVALPDRGFNVPEDGRFSDYPTRVHRIAFELSGAKLSLTHLGTRFMRDANGALMTGLDPGANVGEQLDALVPSPKKGRAAGRICVDSEGIAITKDGRLFVSDEFSANIYCFSPAGDLQHIIAPPEAFVPYVDGEVNFSSADGTKVKRGRAPNDGLEGLSLTPDGRELYALLQSPLAQDRKGPPKSRRYTRLLVYDVPAEAWPSTPKGHYVIELPLCGGRPGVEEVAAAEVNAIAALGGGRFLLLARESFGFGAKERNADKPIVFKQVMAGSLDGASDIAGSKYERRAKPVAPEGELERDIVPVRLEPFVDIADEEELNRVGLSARRATRERALLSAKWESMVLSPPLDPKKPRERLLFVGNDNDFRTRNGFMPDGRYDGGIEHDNMVLAYRVTLPGN
jgi:hypothetical protein